MSFVSVSYSIGTQKVYFFDFILKYGGDRHQILYRMKSFTCYIFLVTS